MKPKNLNRHSVPLPSRGASGTWIEFDVCVPQELVEPVVQLFTYYGQASPVIEEAGGFNPDQDEHPVQGPVTVKMYLPENRRLSGRQARIEAGIRLLSLVHEFPPMKVRRLRPRDWEEGWKAYFGVLRIGRRIVICPTWKKYAVRHDDVLIRLDPGMAFGTGYHQTTMLCLQALERFVEPGNRVLDLGTGSGILAVAASKLGAARVFALDADSQACEVAMQNVNANKQDRRISIVRGSIPHADVPVCNLLVANISAKVLSELSSSLFRYVAPGGVMLASGLLLEQQEEVIKKFEGVGFVIEKLENLDDWVLIIARKRLQAS